MCERKRVCEREREPRLVGFIEMPEACPTSDQEYQKFDCESKMYLRRKPFVWLQRTLQPLSCPGLKIFFDVKAYGQEVSCVVGKVKEDTGFYINWAGCHGQVARALSSGDRFHGFES